MTSQPRPTSPRATRGAGDGDLLLHRGGAGRPGQRLVGGGDVPGARRVPLGVLRLAGPAAVGPGDGRPPAHRRDRSDLGVLGPGVRTTVVDRGVNTGRILTPWHRLKV